MSSPRQDLQGEDEFRFNHPHLVPQVTPDLACYNPSLSEVVGVTAERYLPFFAWIRHIRITSFQNLTFDDWTIENPYANPFGALLTDIPGPATGPRSRPVSWRDRGMTSRDFQWVSLERSFQWRSFKNVLQLLHARGNAVYVVLVSVNPYLQTKDSLERYNSVEETATEWLREHAVPYRLISDLPSGQYADASHPLKAGYARMAQDLFKDEAFCKWMQE